jgi:hypothetical protein
MYELIEHGRGPRGRQSVSDDQGVRSPNPASAIAAPNSGRRSGTDLNRVAGIDFVTSRDGRSGRRSRINGRTPRSAVTPARWPVLEDRDVPQGELVVLDKRAVLSAYGRSGGNQIRTTCSARERCECAEGAHLERSVIMMRRLFATSCLGWHGHHWRRSAERRTTMFERAP